MCLRHFTCNICGSPCRTETLDREIPSCATCGSNVRFRWIVHALSTELFGQSLPLKKFPKDRKIRGISLSDCVLIARVLTRCFDYQNTCLDREPRLDIMVPRAGAANSYDFVVASEVLEHVPPPVQTAFDNLGRLLKSTGFVVFSSPYESTGETIEHFPNLHDWQVVKLHSGHVLLNRTKEGRLETFDDLTVHDGPGHTLETRVFSKEGLLANCAAAGFRATLAEDVPAHGILWDSWSQGFILRKLC